MSKQLNRHKVPTPKSSERACSSVRLRDGLLKRGRLRFRVTLQRHFTVAGLWDLTPSLLDSSPMTTSYNAIAWNDSQP